MVLLPGCKCCGPSGGACASDCRDHYLAVLNNIVRPGNWRQSFMVDFGLLNTDGQPAYNQLTETLTWEHTHADGSLDRIVFRAWQNSTFYDYALHAGRVFRNVLYGLTVNLRCGLNDSIIEISTRVADEIVHTATDGTVTVWPRTSTENSTNTPISIVVPHGDDSPYFTGTYSIAGQPFGSYEPISAISAELPEGHCQVFRRIDSNCGDPPACDCEVHACCYWVTYYDGSAPLPPCGSDGFIGEHGVPHLECWYFMDPGVVPDPGYPCEEVITDLCGEVYYDSFNDLAKVTASINCPPGQYSKSPCNNPDLLSYYYDGYVADPSKCFGVTRVSKDRPTFPRPGSRLLTPEEIKKMKEGNPLP